MLKKKIKILLFTIIFIIAGIIIAWYLKNLRGGIKVNATKEYTPASNLSLYRQDDNKWGNDKLGNSKYTLESSGCVTTSIAMALSDTNAALNPKQMNELFGKKNVYDESGNLQWGILDNIEGYHADVYSEVSSEIIDQCLQAGKYPIVKVHQNKLLSYHHYILIIGSENGEYICMDPLQSETTKLSDYGNLVYAIRCVWYDGCEGVYK